QFKSVEDYAHTLLRRGFSSEKVQELVSSRMMRSDARQDNLNKIILAAHADQCILSSHDDESIQQVESITRMGFSISEFPLNHTTACGAAESGIAVQVGAPNLLRGRSSRDN